MSQHNRVLFECPKCFTALSTDDALMRVELKGVLTWKSIVCPECDKSYTVEQTEPAPHHNED